MKEAKDRVHQCLYERRLRKNGEEREGSHTSKKLDRQKLGKSGRGMTWIFRHSCMMRLDVSIEESLPLLRLSRDEVCFWSQSLPSFPRA